MDRFPNGPAKKRHNEILQQSTAKDEQADREGHVRNEYWSVTVTNANPQRCPAGRYADEVSKIAFAEAVDANAASLSDGEWRSVAGPQQPIGVQGGVRSSCETRFL